MRVGTSTVSKAPPVHAAGGGAFLRAYGQSMRPYYAFVTGITGWVGVAYYQHLQPGQVSLLRCAFILVVLFLSWGVNQIINDYLGLPEDRVNAPHRPMVTGELPAKPALLLSGALLLAVTLASGFLNPWAVLPVVLGVLLNIVYESAKAWSLLGNLVFGLSIAMCAVYGFLACGPLPAGGSLGAYAGLFGLVVLLNAVMTYFTYFKDVAGDARAGKRTFIVRHGLTAARYAGVVGALLPGLLGAILVLTGILPVARAGLPYLLLCAGAALALHVQTGLLYFRYPCGERAYRQLAMAIRACVAGQLALIALYQGPLAVVLLVGSYLAIGLLFNRHRDALA